jgi:hypothetical protein
MRIYRNGLHRTCQNARVCEICCGWSFGRAATYTTLVGHESLKRRTANATRIMKNKSFHSPEVMSNPPGGIDLRERPLEAAALLASASRCESLKFLYFEAVGSGEGGGGEGGRRARTLAAMKKCRTRTVPMLLLVHTLTSVPGVTLNLLVPD